MAHRQSSHFVRAGGFDDRNIAGCKNVQEAFPIMTRDGSTNFGKASQSAVVLNAKDRPVAKIDRQKLQMYMESGYKHNLHAPTEEEYFDGDDDDGEKDSEFYKILHAQKQKPSTIASDAAASSESTTTESITSTAKNVDEEDEDELDAFMADIAVQAKADADKAGKRLPATSSNSSTKLDTTSKSLVPSNEGTKEQQKSNYRADIEEQDVQESYFNYMEQNPNAGANSVDPTLTLSDDPTAIKPIIIDYDDADNPIYSTERSKLIEPLPSVDHSQITYTDFTKNFYAEHDDIKKLDAGAVAELRKKLGIKTSGFEVPRPVCSFAHFGFDEQLMNTIRKSEYTTPTPIQAQAIPAALSGRDVIGIAKTGSGKTAAYLWPMIIHVLDQPELKAGDGPIGLVLAPTRELAQQIYFEAKRFGKPYNVGVACIFGGSSKYEQAKALRSGADICVATPGRMIDMVKLKATNLHRVTYLVLDEADRMFDMGFEPQVHSICNNIRPDRQTLLFSATFKRRIEKLARDVLVDPLRIVQGELNEANEDVEQHVIVLPKTQDKLLWLLRALVERTSIGSVLIFATKKLDSEELFQQVRAAGHHEKCGLIHGDLDQFERNQVLQQFRRADHSILVATDVAARGLDIAAIKTVINFDVARDIETHIHRIGRTGRAGEKGTAYTLVALEKDKEFAGHLVRNLESANQVVPQELLDLAMQSQWFRKARHRNHRHNYNEADGDNSSRRGCGKYTARKAIGLGFSGGAAAAADSMLTMTSTSASVLSGSSVDDVIKAVKDEGKKAAAVAAAAAVVRKGGEASQQDDVGSSVASVQESVSATRATAMRSAMQARFKSNFTRSAEQMQYLEQQQQQKSITGGAATKNAAVAGELINTMGAGSDLLMPTATRRVKKSRWE